MIYFDRTARSILKRIYRSGKNGVLWSAVESKYGDEYGTSFMEQLAANDYTINKNAKNQTIEPGYDNFKDTSTYRAFITSKGCEFVQERCYNFWKWVVPTLISVASLVISTLTALLK